MLRSNFVIVKYMGEIFFKIWYMIAVLPFIIFTEGSKRFSDYLKKKNIYSEWDVWHSLLVILTLLLLILWSAGYR
jgi:hypothetical protein